MFGCTSCFIAAVRSGVNSITDPVGVRGAELSACAVGTDGYGEEPWDAER